MLCLCIVYTKPVIQNCVDCSRCYRTYIPGTVCELPDGNGAFIYDEPQNTCPLCDERQYGDFMNYDLFPELTKPQAPTTDD